MEAEREHVRELRRARAEAREIRQKSRPPQSPPSRRRAAAAAARDAPASKSVARAQGTPLRRQPDAAKPEATQPEPAQPEAAQPEATQPGKTKKATLSEDLAKFQADRPVAEPEPAPELEPDRGRERELELELELELGAKQKAKPGPGLRPKPDAAGEPLAGQVRESALKIVLAAKQLTSDSLSTLLRRGP